MGSPFLQLGAQIKCPHGGTVVVTPTTTTTASASAILTTADRFSVVGCPFQVPAGAGTKPQPCTHVAWQNPAKFVKVNDKQPLTRTSIGICKADPDIPQGSAIIATTQTFASGL